MMMINQVNKVHEVDLLHQFFFQLQKCHALNQVALIHIISLCCIDFCTFPKIYSNTKTFVNFLSQVMLLSISKTQESPLTAKKNLTFFIAEEREAKRPPDCRITGSVSNLLRKIKK